jgi:class 3 adenylate cyclase
MKKDLIDQESQTTILFADIAEFTKYSSSVTAKQVVDMLRELFTEFDRKCLKHKVFKRKLFSEKIYKLLNKSFVYLFNYLIFTVYTIGDCYIVLGFKDANKRNPP